MSMACIRIAGVLLALALAVESARSDKNRNELLKEIARTATEAGETAGVCAIHVESGQRVSLRGDERFPMASVFKLPLAIELLRRADAGIVRLDQKVFVGARDLRPGASPLAERFPEGGVSLAAAELLEMTLVDGDNTAADLLLDLSGGPAAVTGRLRGLGIDGIRVDRSEAELALDFWGVASPLPRAQWSLPMFRRLMDRVPAVERRRAAERFLADSRDTATPDATAQLLVRVQQRQAGLSPARADLLLELLARCRPGPARLKGMLPPGTPVAHRTGTCGETEGISACTNDVGILTLPDGRHAAVAVFVRASHQSLDAREQTIARIGRAVFDHWSAPRR